MRAIQMELSIAYVAFPIIRMTWAVSACKMPDFVNAARCLHCGDIIISRYRHDFVSCSCRDISVDGGAEYVKRSYMPGAQWEEITTEDELLAAQEQAKRKKQEATDDGHATSILLGVGKVNGA